MSVHWIMATVYLQNYFTYAHVIGLVNQGNISNKKCFSWLSETCTIWSIILFTRNRCLCNNIQNIYNLWKFHTLLVYPSNPPKIKTVYINIYTYCWNYNYKIVQNTFFVSPYTACKATVNRILWFQVTIATPRKKQNTQVCQIYM